MRIGNYKIDETYLIMIAGFLFFSLFAPFMLLPVLLLFIIGLEKVEK
ncbi:hypothetical protein ACUW9N_001474 [Staphylococcus auricularis]|uniref:Uncharacterized protein n=1 Tax=Staphylococcus auricularis TaxID=29379 RepID=A0AAW7MDE8_9STAP|nr:hypothetical protein [Staphylococcus auricularis]MCG7342266.1 hypothetical protein [Staphylococcus auricularis]MDC6327108.1 hypothetical protein [Staphylococcus auricularis]MDN4533181.1 hypothetical protein [Staphylococcus auricularis]MDN4533317.1 hypothetical protein [Staphylococcus auricularis]QPT06247.1 hypothetical protein I6G39_00815 [Staphylococcus auricularis]